MNYDAAALFSVYGIEAALAGLALLLIATDLLVGKGRLTGPADAVRLVAQLGLVGIAVWAFVQEPQPDQPFGMLDTFALYWKRFFLVTAIAVLAIS